MPGKKSLGENEFYHGLMDTSAVPEFILKAINNPVTNPWAVDLAHKAVAAISDPFSWAPPFMSCIFHNITSNFTLSDQQLPPMVTAFRVIVPQAKFFFDTDIQSQESIREQTISNFRRDIQTFSRLNKVSAARQAAVQECVDIVTENFPQRPRLALIKSSHKRLTSRNDPGNKPKNG